MATLDRITIRPGLMGGKPCIRGMRVTVSMIVKQLAGGQSPESLLAEFPYLEMEDISQSLSYATMLDDDTAYLLSSEIVRNRLQEAKKRLNEPAVPWDKVKNALGIKSTDNDVPRGHDLDYPE